MPPKLREKTTGVLRGIVIFGVVDDDEQEGHYDDGRSQVSTLPRLRFTCRQDAAKRAGQAQKFGRVGGKVGG
jgi:hypothetical protein